MEVILSQDVERIGRGGQVVKVKDGFARNYLFPNKLAVPLTTANMKRLESEKQARALQQEKVKHDAEGLKEKLAAVSLTIPMLTQEEDKDKLYGSVAGADIAKALKDEGYDVEKSLIQMEEPIRSLGIYQVPVKLHPDVTATVKVWIVKK